MASKHAGGLSGTALKGMALVCMVLDHIHYFFGFTGLVPEAFSMIGRLAAPIFLFCLVEGFAHTHDRRRFFLRIYVMAAAMSLLLFFMMFGGFLVRPDGFYPQNGMMTTMAILIVIWQGIEWIGERRYLRGLLAAALPLVWPFAATGIMIRFPAVNLPLSLLCASVLPIWNWMSPDTGLPLILTGILLFLLRRHRRVQVLAFAAFTMAYDFFFILSMVSGLPGFAFSQMFTDYYEWYGVFAAIPMLCYNGERGRGMKRLFYAFYPAHIYILYALSWALCVMMGRG